VSVITVRTLSTTPVKATRLHTVERVVLDAGGAQGDRRFYVIDARDRMVNGMHFGELTALVAEYAEDQRQLRITLPDHRIVEGEIRLGETVSARFYSEPVVAHLIDGPWSGALSEYAGQPLRLVQAADRRAVDRGTDGGVTLISTASLEKLAEVGDRDTIDPRRFRMLIEIDGLDAHAEDQWVGHSARVGKATVRFHGHVGRCLITSRDPETGSIDVPTLDILRRYRRDLGTTEPLPFGIYGEVVEPGVVRVGDAVHPEG
jgi:uncharacterized protein YcbX